MLGSYWFTNLIKVSAPLKRRDDVLQTLTMSTMGHILSCSNNKLNRILLGIQDTCHTAQIFICKNSVLFCPLKHNSDVCGRTRTEYGPNKWFRCMVLKRKMVLVYGLSGETQESD
ncbi:hypothetical protein XENORESO_019019 [Xenotaenia resolanae]|uniref:Uncharacterized protein n=1 Tax=Xenotaenia resolanae TaxID=208358 RepID=A0ABV0X3K1_9TELE